MNPWGRCPTGIVTAALDPAPPGGGDLTLGARDYTRTFRTTSTFTDVPTGLVRLEARPLWTDSLTLWAPYPPSWSGTLYAFHPLTLRVGYSMVPGQIAFSASGLPGDAWAWVGAGGYGALVPGGGGAAVEALPGYYRTSADPGVSVSRAGSGVSWVEIYTLQGVSPPEVAVRSTETARVVTSYTGPLPGTLCEDDNRRQVAPGAYTAPPSVLVGSWTESYTESCPPGQVGGITVTEWWATHRV
ncbi:MAG: hypothetical protein NZ846_09555 [Thermus sp.]|uniref:hypothetical protein n=1 Tax=Thermus sp. TaxID=275 RepID=UPI0025D8C048|nr:hypothetical protein [Thermus sp.]MCS7219201.1 hypothetical protein [Thermus sp.]